MEQHSVSLKFWPFEYRDSGSFSRDVNFNGFVFPANRAVNSVYRNYRADLMYTYDLLPKKDRWILEAGAGISGQWTHIELATDAGDIYTEVEETIILPLAGLTGGYRLNENWLIKTGGIGMYFNSNQYLEGYLETRYAFGRRWDLRLGTKYSARDIETSDLKEDSEHGSFYFSVSHKFF